MASSTPGMPGMDMSNMDLTIKAQCHIGKLLFSAWDIQNCGQYYVSLVVIAVVCFLRHLLTMHKTRLILRLPDELEAGKCMMVCAVYVCVRVCTYI